MRVDAQTLPARDPVPSSLFALGLFALAFCVRIAFALQWRDTPYGDTPLLDAQIYHRWAADLAAGQGMGQVFYQSPLYPYLLSLIYRLCGPQLFAASLLNALLDSATVTLLGLVARSLYGQWAGALTGLLAVFCAPMIFYAAPPMKEALVLFAATGFVWFALRALERNRLPDYALAGLTFGLAVLARGNFLLLAPLLPGFALHAYRRAAAKAVALFILCAVAALVPATIHNYRAAQDFVPITYADGFNLYIGHSSYANGSNAYPPEVATGPEQERLDTSWIARQAAGHEIKPSEVSAYWRHKALSFAWHHPGRETVLLLRKFLAFFNGGDSFDNYDLPFVKRSFHTLLNWPLVAFGFIVPLAAFGACGTRLRDRRHAFLIAGATLYMLSVLIFYVTDRYRLPVLVFLLPLAGAGLPALRAFRHSRDGRRFAAAVAAALFFALLACAPKLDAVDLSAFDWGVLTAIYADKNEAQSALDAFHNAVALSPQQAGSQAYIRAAGIYENLGQPKKAEELIAHATQLFPADGVAFYNLGRMQAMRGDLKDATATILQAEALTPTYTLIDLALAELYAKQGDKAHALESVWRGLAIDAQEPHLLALQAQLSPP